MILNAFSLNMLSAFPVDVRFEELSLDEARAMAAELNSAVGHAETAAIFGDMLGVTVLCRRETVTLTKGSVSLVGQYRGPRLPEGATSLPAGAIIQWFRVTVL